jgi:plastocyanin
MFTKRRVAAALGFLLLGSTPLVASSTASADQATKVVNIEGKDSFQANAYLLNTYHFAPGIIKVRQGQQVLFDNKTTDAHTMTLVAAADVPRTIPDVFRCKLCNAVNKLYAFGHGQPAGVQIDGGVLQDANDTDADTPDPAAPGPFGALIEDFDTVAHSNPAGAPTIGDSSLLGPVGSPAPTSRTIVVKAAPGSVLHYFCTIHPWMQATILVTK